MSGPSQRALEAADALSISERGTVVVVTPGMALLAAHDPALGIDRSVCLRDAVEVLEARGADLAARALERRFLP